MRARDVARSLLPPLFVNLYRLLKNGTRARNLRSYVRGGKVPWTRGFDVYRLEFLRKAISDERMLQVFGATAHLPGGYGVGLDERCVEYPWFLSRLRPEPERVLDAGSSLNHAYILDHPRLRTKDLHILTLAPEPGEECFWERGISYLFADLRDIPVRDNYYDAIACLSVLQHIGLDNSLHTGNAAHREHSPGDFALVMREFRRVLKPGGMLYLTVPFGAARNFGWMQQFDQRTLDRALESFGPAGDVMTSFYRYTAEGWDVSSMKDCADCKYVQWFAETVVRAWPPPAGSRIPVEPDLAVAARAVACVQMSKPKP